MGKRLMTYTVKERETLESLYKEHGTPGLDVIAQEMGKTVPSIRTTLVIMGKYRPIDDSKKSKRKEKTKGELVNDLMALTGLDLDGLEPAKKDVIQRITKYVQELKQENGNV